MPLGKNGLLSESMRDMVSFYGGKNGIQQFLLDNPVDGVPVPQQEIVDPSERFGWWARRRFKALCRDAGVSELILRSSSECDLDGMVDAMPTIPCVSVARVNGMLGAMKKGIHNPGVIRFAEAEGSTYDPSNVTVAVSPFHTLKRHVVLTEHPNQKGVVLVDVGENDGYGLTYTAIDFIGGALSPIVHGSESAKYRCIDSASRALELHDCLRVSKLFSEDVALQLEIGVHPVTGEAMLFQVRQLADVVHADFKLPKGMSRTMLERAVHRTFGVTNSEGIVLHVVSGADRRAFIDFERTNPGKEYVLIPWNITEELKLDECPRGMRGYVVGRSPKPALPHQNTRLLQMTLKRDGFSFLNAIPLSSIRSGGLMRFISDGREIAWEPLS